MPDRCAIVCSSSANFVWLPPPAKIKLTHGRIATVGTFVDEREAALAYDRAARADGRREVNFPDHGAGENPYY